jgi:signal transduction histidine kinase
VSLLESAPLRERHVSWRRLLAAGLALTLVCALGGAGAELWRFGASDDTARSRVETHVRRDFERMTAVLARVAHDVAGDPAAAPALTAAADGPRTLFDVLDRHVSRDAEGGQIAVTIYNAEGDARAWAGRPSDIRIGDVTSFFVTQSPLGLRLMHVVPILASDQRRVGTVAAEHVLSPAPAPTLTTANWFLPTPLGPAALRMKWEGAGDRPASDAFVLKDPAGQPLVEATISSAAIYRARMTWRRRAAAAVVAALALTLVLLIGPLLDRRTRATAPRVAAMTAGAAALLMAGLGLTLAAIRLTQGDRPPPGALLLLGGAAVAAVAALAAGPVVQLRAYLRRRRMPPSASAAYFVVVQLLAGTFLAAILLVFLRVLMAVIDPATVDLRHFSLYPWSVSRVLLLSGILACHLAALWIGTLALSAALARWRIARSAIARRGATVVLWLLPSAIVAILSIARGWPIPAAGMLLSAAACAAAASIGRRVSGWYRHATVAARILTLFVAFLVPALLLYPSIEFFAARNLRRLIAERYAVEAVNHPQDLQVHLAEVLTEIDRFTGLPALVAQGAPERGAAPRTEPAFVVWKRTVLAQARLTSSIELYDRAGGLVSRFALNFPEYTGTTQAPEAASGCKWDVFGEAAPFGSEERNMLHAEKKICSAESGTPPVAVGSIVVHVVVDYRTLPFITSQNPYIELFRRPDSAAPREGATATQVETVIYGWGLGPIYMSGRIAWPISGELFTRIYKSREPFWTEVEYAGDRYHVYFANDRVAIFALGYRASTLFDDFVHLAELTTFAGAIYLIVLLGTAVFTRLARERPKVGRALLREIRSSFYRKLFLAFVLASVIPVLTLALVIREYFTGRLREDVQFEAARTAAVAQRVLEEAGALQRRAISGLRPESDDLMVWISQLIDQDVNIFEGPRLLATSERDLFASGLLAERTPEDVYRAIVLQRVPGFVTEDRIGTFPYMIAAAPVRAGERETMVTVPLANRQREIEREIDEVDRGVHLAALVFVLLGAGIGLWMAERIADPVRRLTRATRQIARGDFDARIAVRSVDELRRLVDAFNSMAAELKAQRAQLERTHRLEAWAEMARQVAHEIKNPLTPIQLSAEHLRRVHADRGEPLGDVLEGCVTSILSQVRLLRQISAEFSSFASAPTARRAPVDVPPLVAEVVDPYRTGLADRIAIVNRVAAPLPPAFVDRTLVARALANIVENALHAMPGTGSLILDAAADEAFVTIEVRDTGVGMDADALARVFEPYFSTKTTGTGLGLPIALRNVELSGGTLEVDSQKNVGTTVRMKLPRHPASASA